MKTSSLRPKRKNKIKDYHKANGIPTSVKNRCVSQKSQRIVEDKDWLSIIAFIYLYFPAVIV